MCEEVKSTLYSLRDNQNKIPLSSLYIVMFKKITGTDYNMTLFISICLGS